MPDQDRTGAGGGKPLTSARINVWVCRLQAVGKSDAEIGRLVGLSRGAIRLRRLKLGLPPGCSRAWTTADKVALRELVRAHASTSEIARKLKRSRNSVQEKIKLMGLTNVRPRRRTRRRLTVVRAGSSGPAALGPSVADRYGPEFAERLAGIAPGAGAYAALTALAQERGLSHAQVQTAWHAVRREVAHA